MTLCFCNGKGGVGKTTLSILTALALASAGKKVSIIDRDPQRTAKNWVEDQESGGVTLGDKGEIVIIDTPPRLEDPALIASVRQSDIVILVTSPSPADLWTSAETAQLLIKNKAPARLLFNRVRESTRLSRSREAVAEKIGLPVISEALRERTVYQSALLEGWPSLTPEAREELLRVALAILAS